MLYFIPNDLTRKTSTQCFMRSGDILVNNGLWTILVSRYNSQYKFNTRKYCTFIQQLWKTKWTHANTELEVPLTPMYMLGITHGGQKEHLFRTRTGQMQPWREKRKPNIQTAYKSVNGNSRIIPHKQICGGVLLWGTVSYHWLCSTVVWNDFFLFVA